MIAFWVISGWWGSYAARKKYNFLLACGVFFLMALTACFIIGKIGA